MTTLTTRPNGLAGIPARGKGKRPPRERTYLTTGQVATVCGVAPRTVSKWFDAGLLIGYRIPGGLDRRIPAADLVLFCRTRGLPIPAALRRFLPDCPRVLLCLSELDLAAELGEPVAVAPTELAVGWLAREAAPDVVVTDAAGGRAAALRVAAQLRERCAWAAEASFVLVAEDDERSYPEADREGFDSVIHPPIAAAKVAEIVRGLLGGGR